MAFFKNKNKKEEESKDSKNYDQVESELIVHNMPSHERLNKDIDNPKLLGDISVRGGDSQAEQDSKKIGIIIISVAIVIIILAAFLTYKYVISPAAKGGGEQSNVIIPSNEKKEDTEIQENLDKELRQESTVDENLDNVDAGVIAEEDQKIGDLSDNDLNGVNDPMQEEFLGLDAEDLLPLIDSDGDGLFDDEEVVLGTSIHLEDSDNDGHGDLVEIKNFYNPLGTGFLSEASSLSIYKNSKPDFSLLYPNAWEFKKVNDNLFIIDLGEGSLIQLTILENNDRLSILNWYQESFSDLNIPNNRLFSNDIYEGVLSDNHLNIYLADNSKEKIFTFSYIPASLGRLAYANIFEMIYTSLAK